MSPGDCFGFERWTLGPLGGRVGGWFAAGQGGLYLEGTWQAGAAPEARSFPTGLPAAGAGAVPAPGLGHSCSVTCRVEPDLFWDQSWFWPVWLPQTKCCAGQVGSGVFGVNMSRSTEHFVYLSPADPLVISFLAILSIILIKMSSITYKHWAFVFPLNLFLSLLECICINCDTSETGQIPHVVIQQASLYCSLFRCTLHPNDSLAMEGPLSRVKSLKKSLRQSFRRIRKSRVSGKKRTITTPTSKVRSFVAKGMTWRFPFTVN